MVRSNHSLKCAQQLSVEVFMAKMRNPLQPLPVYPTVPSLEVRQLRAKLLLEECLETIRDGLGLDVHAKSNHLAEMNLSSAKQVNFVEVRPANLIQIIDGACDVEVVNKGMVASCGVALRPCFDAVMDNNHLKFAPGHVINEYGKLVKPPSHPNVAELLGNLLVAQGYDPKVCAKDLDSSE